MKQLFQSIMFSIYLIWYNIVQLPNLKEIFLNQLKFLVVMSGFGFEFITEKTRWILKMRCAVTYHCVDVLHSVMHVFDWKSQKINCHFFKERERGKEKKRERERERMK